MKRPADDLVWEDDPEPAAPNAYRDEVDAKLAALTAMRRWKRVEWYGKMTMKWHWSTRHSVRILVGSGARDGRPDGAEQRSAAG